MSGTPPTQPPVVPPQREPIAVGPRGIGFPTPRTWWRFFQQQAAMVAAAASGTESSLDDSNFSELNAQIVDLNDRLRRLEGLAATQDTAPALAQLDAKIDDLANLIPAPFAAFGIDTTIISAGGLGTVAIVTATSDIYLTG